jgi:ligand-binding SRPBCC domain-containing protein
MTVSAHRLERSQRIPRSRDEVFAFFADAANLETITPPFLRFRILSTMPVEMHPGARIEYSLALFGIPFRWSTRITRWEPGVCFVDEQESGPYALWRHTHQFTDNGDATTMKDTVDYVLPLGPLGRMARALFVRRTLDRIFDYRRDAIARRFEEIRPASARAASG